MTSAKPDLIHLHQLHLALKEVQDQLSRGPRQIKARENLIAQADADKVAKEEELKQTRAAVDRKNLDLKTNETKLRDLDRKLNESANNKEYEILRGQIAADNAANSVLQDEVLETLDRVDRVQAEIVEIKARRVKAEQERDRVAAEFAEKVKSLKTEEADLRVKIGEAEKCVPVTIIDRYRRLVEAHGADALASADRGMCNSCYVSLTTQQVQVCRSGEILFCSSCGRMLYFPAG
jgi:predicted  nucleic acid-binding Zn-ribbon protein